MTPTELKAVMRTKKYGITATGSIRTSGGDACPLGVAIGVQDRYRASYSRPVSGIAAKWLGIPVLAAERIAHAADNWYSPWRPLLLNWLRGRIV